MARCEECLHYEVCMYVNAKAVECAKTENCKLFKHTADVVPKSEVDYLREHLEMWCKKYQKSRKEIEQLEAKIAQYQLDLHYSVCREEKATERTARKIFDELEYLSMDGKISMNGYYAELKKKYTEEK